MALMRWLLLLGLCVCVGCTKSGAPLNAVTGVVTLDAKPFAEARVMFIPQGATLGHGGEGITNAEGKYEIIAHRAESRKGLAPGEYKIVITRVRQPDGSPLPPGAKTIEIPTKETAPEPYCKPYETPLRATIGTEAKTFDVSLDAGK